MQSNGKTAWNNASNWSKLSQPGQGTLASLLEDWFNQTVRTFLERVDVRSSTNRATNCDHSTRVPATAKHITDLLMDDVGKLHIHRIRSAESFRACGLMVHGRIEVELDHTVTPDLLGVLVAAKDALLVAGDD